MTLLVWSLFLLFILLLVALDLGVFHRKSDEIKIADALIWTLVWVCVALVFNLFIYLLYGQNWLGWADISTEHLSGGQAALQFFTGYLVEKSLSIDNIFVIAMIFSALKVPLSEQHRVLFWGIIGALVLRGMMILGGVALINRYGWLTYVFGVFLIFSAIKMMVVRHDTIKPDRNIFVRIVKRFLPVSDHFSGSHFFAVEQGRRVATPLFLAIVLVESSDAVFAIDSIPAIMAITRDPFLIFTSNVFAILGLRSLYFALAGMMERFRYLKMSLVFLLAFIGVKMLLSHHHPIPNLVSLAFIAGILAVGIGASLLDSHYDPAALVSPLVDDLEHLAEVTYRQAKRLAVLLVGSTLLLLGIVMVFLPGPGALVIIVGLTVLAAEFAWARLWLRRMKRSLRSLKAKIQEKFND
jgi:tellurite resistance protein TerC